MQNFDTFIGHLKKQLNGSALPGAEAQLNMVPVTRREELKRKQPGIEPRQSAVLILFYPVNGAPRIVFIKRPVDGSIHSGQIAFPGGSVEPEDKSHIETALREASEEVNVDPKTVHVIGQLTDLYIPPSNFDVFPVIGYTEKRPEFSGNNEVDRILEISLSDLLHPDTITTKTIQHRLGKMVDVPCFYVEDEIIWGATAMMLGELLALIRN